MILFNKDPLVFPNIINHLKKEEHQILVDNIFKYPFKVKKRQCIATLRPDPVKDIIEINQFGDLYELKLNELTIHHHKALNDFFREYNYLSSKNELIFYY